jgi:large subunit ribosomal protein L10
LALTREQKVQLVQEYGERLGRAQVSIWARYGGISVAQLTQLRRQVQAVGAEIVVVKNTLLRRALEESGLPYDPEVMTGPCIVAFAYDDIAQATKVMTDFARTSQERVRIVGGIVGGRLVSAQQVASLTDMPSREQLLARVLGGVQAPISGLVGVLSSVLRGVITVVNARAQQLEGSDA